MKSKIREVMEAKNLTVNGLFAEVIRQGLEDQLPYNTILNYYYGRSQPGIIRRRLVAQLLKVEPLAIAEV